MDVAGSTPSSSTPPVIDTGHACLVALARFHQLAVDASAFRERFGRLEDTATLLRAARAIGLEAGVCTAAGSELNRYNLPAIAHANDGSFFVIVRVIQTGILIHDLRQPRPEMVTAPVLGQRWCGELIQVARRAHRAGETLQPFGLRWFLPVMMKYRHLLIEVLVASLFLQLFALLTPLFFQVVMDKVLVHRGYTTLDVLAIGLLAMLIFEMVLGSIRNYLLSHTAHRIDVELGARLYRHLASLPLAWFQSRPAGQAVARMRELDTIRHFMTGTALTLVMDLVFTSVFIAVMWYECAPLAMIVLAALPLYVLLSWFVTPVLRIQLEDKSRSAAENQSLLVESVTGMETIKSLALESRMQQEWEERLAQHVYGSFRAQHLNSMASQLATLVNRLVTLAIIWYGARLVMDNTISVGQLVAVNMLAGRVSGPILKIAQLWHEFQQVGIAVRRLADILDTPREPGLLPGRHALPRLSGQVRFESVSFRYRADSPRVIDALDFEVKPGEVIGVVGRSGSGKSTLGKLLQRLYVPEQGRIVLDGVDLALLDTTSVRRRIGVVLQDSFLFNRSIRDNIAIADPGMSMESVMRVAKIANAHDFILALPQGYDTVVGDRGNNLSGGQRQRIAIARALAGNPVILVFDEATSALDQESERIIQDNMAAICRGRTVFIIAHRLATVRHCHRIVVLDKGRIVEQGSHDSLLARGDGYYARMHRYPSVVPDRKSRSGEAA